MSSRAAQRLLHDYQEVCAAREIVGLIDASPLEDNLFEWHVNLWLLSSTHTDSEVAAASAIHLVLSFTEDYPSQPPSVLLCTPFPHANVVRKANGTYAICLDMLEPRKSKSPYSGWSSAMSVLSILIQLQAFLTTKKLHYSGAMEFQGSMDRSLRQMADFECKKCTHHGAAAPWPVRREKADCAPPPARLVCRPCGTVAPAAPAAEPVPWTPKPPPPAAAPPTQPAAGNSKPKASSNLFAVLSPENDDDVDSVEELTGATCPAASVADDAKSDSLSDSPTVQSAPHQLKAAAGALATKVGPSKRTQKKNAYRTRKRALGHHELHASEEAKEAAPAATEPATSAEPSMAEPSMAEQVACAVLEDSRDEARVAEQAAAECAGPFALLSYDALIILMEKLHTEADVRALACTCSHLRGACDDGLLWRVLFHRHFPASQLSAASLSDWRHAYMLELSSNAEQLRCYHSKVTLGALDQKRGGPEVFGIPLTFTVNPRTHEVDCIYSTLDALSFSAFKDDGVRTSVWGEDFTHFLPLFLTKEHFRAALPILTKTLANLCAGAPKWRFARGRFVPEMVLDVLPKLLCTLIVLLVDKGVAASDVFIDGFVQVYRLLLALADEYPRLRDQVTAQEPRASHRLRGVSHHAELAARGLLHMCRSRVPGP